MENNAVIQVNRVSKKFCRSLKRSMWYGFRDILRDTAGLRPKSDRLRRKEFWAVDGVSFELRKGETLGLIGPNGAGKTTILKMLNGIIIPDKGGLRIKGRVGALIQLGAGFHPQLTGRENIYINGAILGMGKREIDKKFDAIIEFADIGDFLDTPVKFYSSGMFVRLGFAVAAHFEPDILLVDEVLAVGDEGFRARCYDWFAKRLLQKKSTIFISHNTDVVRRLCSRCLVIDHGSFMFDGEVDQAIDCYMNSLIPKIQQESLTGFISEVAITSARLLDKQGKECRTISSGEDIFMEINYRARRRVENPIVGVAFVNAIGILVVAVNSQDDDVYFPALEGKGTIRVRFIAPRLAWGYYFGLVSLNRPESAALRYDFYRLPNNFQVQNSNCRRGIVSVETDWFLNNKLIQKK